MRRIKMDLFWWVEIMKSGVRCVLLVLNNNLKEK